MMSCLRHKKTKDDLGRYFVGRDENNDGSSIPICLPSCTLDIILPISTLVTTIQYSISWLVNGTDR